MSLSQRKSERKAPAKSFGLVLTCLMLILGSNCLGQELLERRISFRAVNEPLDQVLERISNLGGFNFSYSPDVVDIKGKITYQANRQSIREILTELFRGKISFKERRKYIILQKNTAPEEDKVPENFQLNGYIIDSRTGEKLANASIFESITLASTVSNQYGYYRLKLPVSPAGIRLEVRKEEYVGRSIPVLCKKDTYLAIELSPDTLKRISGLSPRLMTLVNNSKPKVDVPQFEFVSIQTVSVDTSRQLSSKQYPSLKNTYQKVQNQFINAFESAKQAVNTRNISDTLHRHFQASLLPFLGTNHHLSGNVVNDVSINFIAGYSLGVNAVEIGAIANVVRGNVRGFQFAGISNIVGHDVNGFQYANFVNVTLGNITGFQGSHGINYTGRNFKGVQMAGVGNVVVGTLHGWQLSSGYNYAYTVRSGHQIGLINYTDSTATVPFGLFSYVRTNGYRRYEFSASEFSYFNFSFKTGVNRFYNIFTLGFNGLATNKALGTIGYGFGTAQKLGRGWMINADLTGNIVLLNGQRTDEIAAGMLRFTASVEKKLGNRFALFAGPAISLFSGKYSSIVNTEKTGVRPIWIGSTPDRMKNNFGWVGFQAGLRFCNRL